MLGTVTEHPRTSDQTVVNLVGAFTTTTGLKVHAELDDHNYPTGIRISDADMQALPLCRHEWHGEWNYSLTPDPTRPTPTELIRHKP